MAWELVVGWLGVWAQAITPHKKYVARTNPRTSVFNFLYRMHLLRSWQLAKRYFHTLKFQEHAYFFQMACLT